MGTSYYAVKGDEKIYIGKNLPLYFSMRGYAKMVEDVIEYFEEDRSYEYREKPIIELTFDDICSMLDDVKVLDAIDRLISYPFLFGFLLMHLDEIDEWDVQPDG